MQLPTSASHHIRYRDYKLNHSQKPNHLQVYKAVVHKLGPAGQIRPVTSRQVACEVQQESFKYKN